MQEELRRGHELDLRPSTVTTPRRLNDQSTPVLVFPSILSFPDKRKQ